MAKTEQTPPSCTKYIPHSKLESLYHLPVSEASKNLGISIRTFQRLCKFHRIRRWPYRRIRSINRAVENLLCYAVETEDEDEFQNYVELIELYEMKKLFIMMAATWPKEAQDNAAQIPVESLAQKEVFDSMIESTIHFSTAEAQQRASGGADTAMYER
mmetsp:Transcript_13245/g.23546  ORF Transcript_13245/g.23546 Transcript_13245/m.23546 type:complete len:158 (-) Transcript_13245:64-537(-)|eukprot:CAMPEP_0194576662 /NCGR_PEP_ID=MMETSP0292-20121207/11715_1 /TAXON_ID=39354 /ORGANISM="Heterosigma akashiwo, Strain CCMP2393" /LENGTH=157 /DNA_ID=CAMNT_0039428811 /DNA_START=76 /DNA_END=549 /DNA_ORIENTATION=+